MLLAMKNRVGELKGERKKRGRKCVNCKAVTFFFFFFAEQKYTQYLLGERGREGEGSEEGVVVGETFFFSLLFVLYLLSFFVCWGKKKNALFFSPLILFSAKKLPGYDCHCAENKRVLILAF